jgi:hypothetical protein
MHDHLNGVKQKNPNEAGLGVCQESDIFHGHATLTGTLVVDSRSRTPVQ